MNDFNEDVTNILNSIKSLYKGCKGIDCKDCPLSGTKCDSIKEHLCYHLYNKVLTLNEI